MQLIKATTSVDMNSLEGKGCHQPAVPEEVDTSPPKFMYWPVIDIDNLPKMSPSDAQVVLSKQNKDNLRYTLTQGGSLMKTQGGIWRNKTTGP